MLAGGQQGVVVVVAIAGLRTSVGEAEELKGDGKVAADGTAHGN